MMLKKRLLPWVEKIHLLSAAILLIITFLEFAFIGKNITFTSRFTPEDSQQYKLKIQSYISEAQLLTIFICLLYVFLIPSATYSSRKQSKKAFLPILFATLTISGVLVFLNIYFLLGASEYRNYMSRQFQNLLQMQICLNSQISLCQIGNCVRLQVFYEARRMAIAFCVLDIIFSIVFGGICLIMNKKRKHSEKMELIV